jgi:hypothetical protein
MDFFHLGDGFGFDAVKGIGCRHGVSGIPVAKHFAK